MRTKWSNEMNSKYDRRSGCYAIFISDRLVYIGKSINMKRRLQEHIYYIKHPEKYNSINEGSNKYKVLNEAYNRGFEIRFDVIYYGNDIDIKEVQLINNYLPPLNYYLSPEQRNDIALSITLNEILTLPTTQMDL